MNLLKSWVFPLVIALLLVLIFRWLLFDFMIVPDNLMKNTLKKGDLVLIQKSGKIRHNSIVLFKNEKGNNSGMDKLIRCVGLPGDTLQIKNTLVYINRKKQDSKYSRRRKITVDYVFHTDSSNIQEVFEKSKVPFNQRTAIFGVFSFHSDIKELKKIEEQTVWTKKQKMISPKGLYSDFTSPFNTHFYWNTDNLGRLIVPATNKPIKLNRGSFSLYKDIIMQETGKDYRLEGNSIFLMDKIVKTYTFKHDYYFVLNDNRPNHNDSRSFGFIRRNQISGKFVMKLF